MFQFPGFASKTLCIQVLDTWLTRLVTSKDVNNWISGGFPHSEISGSKPIPGSPKLIAGYRVLHRLLLPRHPPNALIALDPIRKKKDRASLRNVPAFRLESHFSRPPPGSCEGLWLVYLTWTAPPLVRSTLKAGGPPHPHSGDGRQRVSLSERCEAARTLIPLGRKGRRSVRLDGQAFDAKACRSSRLLNDTGKPMVEPDGFEPTTLCLQSRCSTN